MRARSRNEIAFIVLIAIIAAGVTALAFRFVPAAAGAGAPSTASGPAAAGPRDTVIVIGEGTQLATPDIAILNLGVQRHSRLVLMVLRSVAGRAPRADPTRGRSKGERRGDHQGGRRGQRRERGLPSQVSTSQA